MIKDTSIVERTELSIKVEDDGIEVELTACNDGEHFLEMRDGSVTVAALTTDELRDLKTMVDRCYFAALKYRSENEKD